MILQGTIIVLYTVSLLLILMYAIAQLNLLINYLNAKKKTAQCPLFDFENPEEIPVVTIQLPVYNEMYVIQRLLDNIAKIQYPREKLEIQVLDDSTDESLKTTALKIKQLQATGLDIKHITRKDRTGFKAGALKQGLEIAKGEYIAIFDADFLPQQTWLYTVSYTHLTLPTSAIV